MPANSNHIILDGNVANGHLHYALIGDEVVDFSAAKYFRATNANINDAVPAGIQLARQLAPIPPANGYLNARITINGSQEWISYSGVTHDRGHGDILTGVVRSQFGTQQIAQIANASLYIPAQFDGVSRQQFNTAGAVIHVNSVISPVGVFIDLAGANVQLRDSISYFSSPDDMIRHLIAHEVGHAVGLNHFSNTIINNGNSRGDWLSNNPNEFDGLSRNFNKDQMDQWLNSN